MRRFLTASICLVILFAGFGCGEKKGSSKASLRARAGTLGGNTADTNTIDPQKATDSAGKINTCENTVSTSLTSDEVEVKEFKDLLLEDSKDEYILTTAEHFYSIEGAGAVPGQIHTKVDGFFDSKAGEALANTHSAVICDNAEIQKKDISSNWAWPVSFNLADGGYPAIRKFEATALAGKKEPSLNNTIVGTAGNIASDEAAQNLLQDSAGVRSILTKSKDDSSVQIRIVSKQQDETNKGITYNNTIHLVYKKRAIPAQ